MDYFRRCARLERRIGNIYAELARNTLHSPKLQSVWQQLAADEYDHAQAIEMASRLPHKDTFEEDVLSPAFLQQLEQRLDHVEQAFKQKNLAERQALELALELEGDFRQIHVTLAKSFKNAKLLEVFQRLGRDENDHVATLKDYLAAIDGQ